MLSEAESTGPGNKPQFVSFKVRSFGEAEKQPSQSRVSPALEPVPFGLGFCPFRLPLSTSRPLVLLEPHLAA